MCGYVPIIRLFPWSFSPCCPNFSPSPLFSPVLFLDIFQSLKIFVAHANLLFLVLLSYSGVFFPLIQIFPDLSYLRNSGASYVTLSEHKPKWIFPKQHVCTWEDIINNTKVILLSIPPYSRWFGRNQHTVVKCLNRSLMDIMGLAYDVGRLRVFCLVSSLNDLFMWT